MNEAFSTQERTPRKNRILIASLCILGAVVIAGYLLIRQSVREMRTAARKTQSINNLDNINFAQRDYATQHDALFAAPTLFNEEREPVHGWITQLLPLLDNAALYESMELSVPWDHPDNQEYTKLILQVALNRELDEVKNADGYPLLHYTLNERFFPDNTSLSQDYLFYADGSTNTILMGEIQEGLPAWAQPGNARDPALGLKPGAATMGVSVWGGETIIGFADGRVRTISNHIDPNVLKALSTPDGGEVIPEDW